MRDAGGEAAATTPPFGPGQESATHLPASRFRRRGLLVICASVAVTLLVVEAVARLCFAPPEYFVGHPFDPDLGFTEIPARIARLCDEQGEYPWVLNTMGFRGPDLPARGAPAGAGPRVLFIGDSFLNGWGVRDESLMPASTQRALAGLEVDAQCLNASCSGYGTGQELLLLRKYGAQVRPDVVVLCMYSGNDVVDNSIELAGLTSVSNGAWVRPYFVPGPGGELVTTHLHPLGAWLRSQSRAYTLLDHRIFQWLYRDEGQYLRKVEGRPVAQAGRLALGLVPWADLELFREPKPGDDWDRAWHTTEELMRTFDREVRGLGARLLVVVIPHAWQVQSDASFRQIDASALDLGQASMLETLDWNRPERRLDAFFGEAGIAHVCLLEHLRADLRSSGRSGYVHDFHLSSHGHEVAGGIVAQELVALLGHGAPPPAEDRHDGTPVDVLALAWSAGGTFRFTESHDELVGYGWASWGCNWYGAGPSWAMEAGGWLVLPGKRADYVVECFLPPDAPFPVRFETRAQGHSAGAPLVVEKSGPFELRIHLEGVPPDTPWLRVLIQADRTIPQPSGQIGMLMLGLHPSEGEASPAAALPEPARRGRGKRHRRGSRRRRRTRRPAPIRELSSYRR